MNDRTRLIRACVLLALLCSPAAWCEAQWTIEGALGDAYDFRTQLRIEQGDAYEQEVSAQYESRPLEDPPYYAIRFARWLETSAWELQFVHHKLHLENRPPGVTSLSSYRRGPWEWRVGAGPVITHAEANVNGVSYDGPYELAGAFVTAGFGRRVQLGERWFLNAEAAAVISYAKPSPEGPPNLELSVRNAGVHYRLGVGYRL